MKKPLWWADLPTLVSGMRPGCFIEGRTLLREVVKAQAGRSPSREVVKAQAGRSLRGACLLAAALTFLSLTLAGAAQSAGSDFRFDLAAGRGFPISPQRISNGWDGAYALEARLHYPMAEGTDLVLVAGRSLFALRQGGDYGGLNITRLKNIVKTQGGALEVRSVGGAVFATPWSGAHLRCHVLLSISLNQVLQRRVSFVTPDLKQIVTPPEPGSHLGVVFGAGITLLTRNAFSPFLEVVDHIVNAVPVGVDEGALQFPTVKVGVTTRLR